MYYIFFREYHQKSLKLHLGFYIGLCDLCVKKGIKQTFHGRFLAWGRHGTRIGLRNWGLTVRSTVAYLHKFKLGIVFFHVFIMFIYICVCVFVRVFIIIQLSSQDML